ncbi:MAG: heme exporter protein CcmD [Gammaproteobacteria bacterium]
MLEAIQFSSFSEFINMGGYGFNVWSVYGIFAVFIVANLVAPLRKRKQIVKDLKRRALLNENPENSG